MGNLVHPASEGVPLAQLAVEGVQAHLSVGASLRSGRAHPADHWLLLAVLTFERIGEVGIPLLHNLVILPQRAHGRPAAGVVPPVLGGVEPGEGEAGRGTGWRESLRLNLHHGRRVSQELCRRCGSLHLSPVLDGRSGLFELLLRCLVVLLEHVPNLLPPCNQSRNHPLQALLRLDHEDHEFALFLAVVPEHVLAEFFVSTSDSAHDLVPLDVDGDSLGADKIQIGFGGVHGYVVDMHDRNPHVASLNYLVHFHVELAVVSRDELDGWHFAEELIALLINLLHRETQQIRVTKCTDLLRDLGGLGWFSGLGLSKSFRLLPLQLHQPLLLLLLEPLVLLSQIPRIFFELASLCFFLLE